MAWAMQCELNDFCFGFRLSTDRENARERKEERGIERKIKERRREGGEERERRRVKDRPF